MELWKELMWVRVGGGGVDGLVGLSRGEVVGIG